MTIQRYKMENGSVGYYTKTDKGFFVEKDAKEYWKQEGDKLGGAETSGTLERMAIGGGKKVHDLVSGINDLTDSNLPGGNSRYDASESYRQLKEDNPLSVGGGEVLSEIGQMVAPGFGLIRGAAQIPKLGTAGAAFLGDSAAAVGMAGLRAPGDDGETRLGNMGGEAVASAAGGAFGQLLKKLAYGSKLVGETPEQQQLVREALDSGQDLTLGQAGAGVAAKGAHKLASIVPFISRPVDVWNKETIANWHKHILEAAKYPEQKLLKVDVKVLMKLLKGIIKHTKIYGVMLNGIKLGLIKLMHN